MYLSPKKAGVAKKSQQKMDRERREAEAKMHLRQLRFQKKIMLLKVEDCLTMPRMVLMH